MLSLTHSNLIALSSCRTTQLPPTASNSTLPALVTKIHQSSQLPEQPAQLTQAKAGLNTLLPLDQAGNSPKSRLLANQQGGLPWWAQDFEQEPIREYYKALEDEMQVYYNDFVSKHGHLPVGAADRYDKYNLRSRQHRS
jgi:hypothetical protein